MKPESNTPVMTDTEARITALLLGELTSDEARLLEEQIRVNAEWALLYERLRQTIGLVRDAALMQPLIAKPKTGESGGGVGRGGQRLSSARRDTLLAAFKTVPMPTIPVAEPGVKGVPPKMTRKWRRSLMAMAAAVSLILAAGLVLPSLVKAKATAKSRGGPAEVFAWFYKQAPSAQIEASASRPPPAALAPVDELSLAQNSESLSFQPPPPSRPAGVGGGGGGNSTLAMAGVAIDAVPASPVYLPKVVANPSEDSVASTPVSMGRPMSDPAAVDAYVQVPEVTSAPQLSAPLEPRMMSRYGLMPAPTPVAKGPASAVAAGAANQHFGVEAEAKEVENTRQFSGGQRLADKTRELAENLSDGVAVEPNPPTTSEAPVARTAARPTVLAALADTVEGERVEELRRGEREVQLGELDKRGLVANGPGVDRASGELQLGLMRERLSKSIHAPAIQDEEMGRKSVMLRGSVAPPPASVPRLETLGQAAVDAKKDRWDLGFVERNQAADRGERRTLAAGKPMALPKPISLDLEAKDQMAAKAGDGVRELDTMARGSQLATNSAEAAEVSVLGDQPELGETFRAKGAGASVAMNTPVTSATAVKAKRMALVVGEPQPTRSVVPVTPAAPTAQPEVLTATNAFSTFSLNVADVSFQLASASLESGQLPGPETVRVEEFVNAFDYRDPQPSPGSPVGFVWERARYPFAHNRDVLRFSIKTAAQGREAGRPMNLVVLLDNSGSMERADRVAIIRHAMRALAGQLRPQDRVSVVAFARTPRLWVDGLSGAQASELADRVAALSPEGGTNLEEALSVGYQTALSHFQPRGINRVILLTDGAANLGEVEPEALQRTVESYRTKGVALDCFGIGWEGLNDAMLERLARNGDGRYGFVNTPEEASSRFVNQLAGALQVAAADVKVQVEFNPSRVPNWRQIGYAKHQLKKEQFRDNTVDAAELAAAEAGNALYLVQVDAQGNGPLATVRVRYREPETGQYRELSWPVPYAGSAPALEDAAPSLRLASSAASFGEWLTGGGQAGEVSLGAMATHLRGVAGVFAPDPRPQQFEAMLGKARSITGQ